MRSLSRAPPKPRSASSRPRAVWLRALMAELERVVNHFGDIGAICNAAAFSMMLAHCGVLRERVLRTADAAFGHRLMRDVVVPGGVAKDIDAAGIAAIREMIAEAQRKFPPLIRFYDDTASLQDRTVGTGILRPELAAQFAAGGYVGRASGSSFDARRDLAYAPYDALSFEVPVRTEGDVDARVWIRIREIEQSLTLIARILDQLPDSAIRADVARQGVF
jgi:Ni,Fe-hydrogenase III large subunit